MLDDLHWADASSLRLLAHVASAEPTARLLLAGAYTDGESAFGELLRELAGERVELCGLSLESVRALLPAGAPPTTATKDVDARHKAGHDGFSDFLTYP